MENMGNAENEDHQIEAQFFSLCSSYMIYGHTGFIKNLPE